MDHLQLLKSGIERWNLWRTENPGEVGNLANQDLRDRYFFEANFNGTDLSGSDLQRACLIGADLRNADLSQANLSGTYLGNADLRGANLREANLAGAVLDQADLRGAMLTETDMSKANISRARFSNSAAVASRVKEAAAGEPVSTANRTRTGATAVAALDRKSKSYEASTPSPDKKYNVSLFVLDAKSLTSRAAQILINRPVIYTATAVAAILVLAQPLYKTAFNNRPDTGKTATDEVVADETATGRTVADTTAPTGQSTQPAAESSNRPLAPARSLESKSQIWAIATHTRSDNQLLIASGEANGQVKLWDGQTGDVIRTLPGHNDTVRDLAISSTGQQLASSSGDGIKVWDVETGALVYAIPAAGSPVWSLAISPDDSTLISGDYAGKISAWQLDTGEPLYSVENGSTVWSLAIAPSGETFVSGGKEGIRHWSLSDGWKLQAFKDHAADVRSVAISPDGQTLVSGSWDNTIKLWDLNSGKLKTTLEGHEGRVVTVAISEDGTRLASGSIDNTTKLWDLEREALLETFDGTDWILDVAFATPEQTLLSSGKDQSVRLWQ